MLIRPRPLPAYYWSNKLKTLSLDLEYCYGIRRLQTTLDYTNAKAIAVYAPNGSMKTSLAQAFEDISRGTDSKDRIFPNRPTKRVVKVDGAADLGRENVLVVKPYDEVFGHSAQTSTLLVNAELRKEYESLHADIDAAKAAFLKGLKEQSGSKRSLDKEISSTFTASDDQFYIALGRIKEELQNQTDTPFASVPYDLVMDEKVLSFLGTKDFKVAIDGYIKKYNELIGKSNYFKKGTFNYYNAATIAKQLADNGFFKARHTVNLNAESPLEIKSEEELEAIISNEKEAISNDPDLRKKFADIEKQIQKNVALRDFEQYLQNHEDLLAEFANVAAFKEKLWKSYIKAKYALYIALVEKYQAAEARRKEIQEQAAKERTQWEDVIDIFNTRFFVPFTLKPDNKVDVILGQQPLLTLGFIFNDGLEDAAIGRDTLLQALSTGEKKAFYILNILFEIEVRRKAKQETLIVVDDIADSFDYKNKYAIIQYLTDISEDLQFRQLILTHNFDFYRTLESRFVSYEDCFMVSKTNTGVELGKAKGIKNVFVRDWKPAFFSNTQKKVACIPFMRNLIEYTKGDADQDYLRLTSLLHWKPGSDKATIADLDDIYIRLFETQGASTDATRPVMDVIRDEAAKCLNAPEGINFENKVILAIATRLAAEQYMIKKINDDAWVGKISADQTAKLVKKFKSLFATHAKAISVLQRVVLMTPENIHLNSFMYEPILDMSDNHLRQLYEDVIALT